MGVFARIGGTLYAPDFDAHAGGTATSALGTYTPWTPVNLGLVTGTGASTNPYTCVVDATAGTTGLDVQMTVTYANADDHFQHDLEFTNTSTGTIVFDVFLGSDLFLASSDSGVPAAPPCGSGTAVGGVDCGPGTFNSLHLPVTPADHYTGTGFSSVWSQIGGGLLNDAIDTGCLDNGAALQWESKTLAPGASLTIRSATCLGDCLSPACLCTAGGPELLGLNPGQVGVDDTAVLKIEKDAFLALPLGFGGAGSLSGMDIHPATGEIHVTSGFGDGGNLYYLDDQTGQACLVGPTGFSAVSGLAFCLDGTLVGSAFVSTTGGEGLIEINRLTGAATLIGLYGSGIAGIDALAVDPASGTLFGTSRFATALLFEIDRVSGLASLVCPLSEDGSGLPPGAPIAGLAFDEATGELFGSLGQGDGRVIEIDLATCVFSYCGDATPAGGSVSDIVVMPCPPPQEIVVTNPNSALGGNGIVNVCTVPFTKRDLGVSGTSNLGGIDESPLTGRLCASGGLTDGGNIYDIDPCTGAATLIGPSGFQAVPGLTFGPDGTLYGSAFASGSNGDSLVVIDKATGAGTLIGPYGGVSGVDAIACDPCTGQLFGSSGFDLIEIDKASAGILSVSGALVEGATGAALPAKLAGLDFDAQGNLYGSLGAGDGRIVSIDRNSLTFEHVGEATDAGSAAGLCIRHVASFDVGYECPCDTGNPPTKLKVTGYTGSGTQATVQMTGGAPSSFGFLIYGLSVFRPPFPFSGCEIVPFGPIISRSPDANGNDCFNVSLSGSVPIWLQYVMFDLGSSTWCSSNAAKLPLFP